MQTKLAPFSLLRLSVYLALSVGLFGFISCAQKTQVVAPAGEYTAEIADLEAGEALEPDVNAAEPPEALDEDAEPVDRLPEEVALDFPGGYRLIKIPKTDFPVVLNEPVLAWINYFTGKGRPIFQKWLYRRPLVEPTIRKTLAQYGLPQDLMYLSMIESGFNAHAYSRARAAGAWQFMQGTGKLYGLKVDYWIDERRNLDKASDAAARHLNDLHQLYGDWYLAMAAYNAGAGKVNRAIVKHSTRDFWELAEGKKRYLRPETRNYVPKMLAALIIAKQPEAFGFDILGGKEFEPIKSEIVTIDDAVDLQVVADCAQVDAKVIKDLNPEIRHWFTPPEAENYPLRIPEGKKEMFLANYEKVPKDNRITFRHHKLRSGENLSTVARRYGTTVAAIMKINKISNPRAVRSGSDLMIPIRRGEALADPEPDSIRVRASRKTRSSTPARSIAVANGSRQVSHVVRSGETLWHLSQRYQVSLTSLRKWNGLSASRRIFPGEVLKIYPKNV